MTLENIIGVIVAAFLIAAIILEIRNRNKKSDLFTNIVISVIGLGCSVYMLFNIYKVSLEEGHFSSSVFFSQISTWIYIVVILLTFAFSVVFLMFHFKNKDLPEQTEEENEEDEDEYEKNQNLTDEEIEDILEQENGTDEPLEDLKEDLKEDSEEDVVLESLTAQKPKVLPTNEEDFKFKEGATQVPTNQRNPFEKK